MKKISFILIWMLCFAADCMSQQLIHVDYNQIKEQVENHPAEYKALLQRYISNDSLLTSQDYALIYYGHSYTPAYKGSFENYTDFNNLLKAGKTEEAYLWGNEHLGENPVSLKLLYQMYLLAKQLQLDPAESNGYKFKYFQLLKMLAQSGDGQSEQTAYKVISINDEYQVAQQYWKIKEISGQSLINQSYDVLEFKPVEHYKGNKMYFDISRSLEHMRNLFK